MFDSITNSADGLFILLYILSLVVFFLFGPHKVYESLFWALLGLGLYLLVHEMTFVYPEITRTLFFGNQIVENRWTILWASKWFAVILFFITPITLGLNVSGVVRGTLWFFLKTIILSTIFIVFGVVLFLILSGTSGAFGEVELFPASIRDISYFQNSQFLLWMTDKTAIVLLLSFMLAFYKIIFSHWVSRLLFIGWLMYARSNEMFSKKNLDTVIPIEADYVDQGDIETHNDMHR